MYFESAFFNQIDKIKQVGIDLNLPLIKQNSIQINFYHNLSDIRIQLDMNKGMMYSVNVYVFTIVTVRMHSSNIEIVRSMQFNKNFTLALKLSL